MKKALVLCTGNSCRSQMAEGLWNHLGQGRWRVHSAGSKPAGFVHPMAVQVMKEIGIDISKNKSLHIEEFSHEQFDVVVTVCDRAKKTCPTLPGAPVQHHWPFDDPAFAEGSEEQRRQVFRRVRDEIRERIESFLAG
jgi:arsenate reductase (thioredoxin)